MAQEAIPPLSTLDHLLCCWKGCCWQLAVSPTEQFCRVHHNLWILSLFILKVSFFHKMYERINGGHERDCSQVPFNPTVFCMSAVGFLSFRLCELSSYHIISYVQYDHTHSVILPSQKNRFHRMQRKSQTRSEKPNMLKMLKMPRILWDIFWFLWHFDRSWSKVIVLRFAWPLAFLLPEVVQRNVTGRLRAVSVWLFAPFFS